MLKHNNHVGGKTCTHTTETMTNFKQSKCWNASEEVNGTVLHFDVSKHISAKILVGLDTIQDNRYCSESGTRVCVALVTMRIQLIALGLTHKDSHTVIEYLFAEMIHTVYRLLCRV